MIVPVISFDHIESTMCLRAFILQRYEYFDYCFCTPRVAAKSYTEETAKNMPGVYNSFG